MTNKQGTGVLRHGWGRDTNSTNGSTRLTFLYGTGKKRFLNISEGALKPIGQWWGGTLETRYSHTRGKWPILELLNTFLFLSYQQCKIAKSKSVSKTTTRMLRVCFLHISKRIKYLLNDQKYKCNTLLKAANDILQIWEEILPFLSLRPPFSALLFKPKELEGRAGHEDEFVWKLPCLEHWLGICIPEYLATARS